MDQRAHTAVLQALRHGQLIKPEVCEHCGKRRRVIQGHHYLGYEPEHWLDVQWLCTKCHGKAHRAVVGPESQLTLRFPKDFHHELRIQAALRQISITQLVLIATQVYLTAHPVQEPDWDAYRARRTNGHAQEQV